MYSFSAQFSILSTLQLGPWVVLSQISTLLPNYFLVFSTAGSVL